MATVTGLTAERMAELAADWEQILATQQEMAAKINDLQTELGMARGDLVNFNSNVVPDLKNDVGGYQQAMSELSLSQSELQDSLVQNQQALDNIGQVDIPSLQGQIGDHSQRFNEIPITLTGDTMPVNGDDPNRPLVVGDLWYDPSDNKQYRWTGTEWVPSSLEVADLSLTARKFKVSTHMIY